MRTSWILLAVALAGAPWSLAWRADADQSEAPPGIIGVATGRPPSGAILGIGTGRPPSGAILGIGVGALGGPQAEPAPLDRKVLDEQIFASLRTVINYGADLYNNRDAAGCYHVFRTACVVTQPLLDHRPDLQKAIREGMAEAEKDPDMAKRAWVLRKVLDQVRAAVKPAVKIEEKKTEDKKPDDKKPEDKKTEDKKPEDKKPEDKKPDDKKDVKKEEPKD